MPTYRRPPQATTRRSRRISIIWIVPLVAVAIGAWLAWDTLSKEGPTIKISFDSGEGLQAGQSQLKYKDIVFGTVKSLALSPDQTHVIVTVATTRAGRAAADRGNGVLGRQAAALRRQYFRHRDPAFGLLYRHVAGGEAGKSQRDFTGREDPPVLGAHVPGARFC